MKPIHTARGLTNISYIQSSGYLYGHTKIKRRRKPQKTCLYVTSESQIGRIAAMQQVLGRWKPHETIGAREKKNLGGDRGNIDQKNLLHKNMYMIRSTIHILPLAFTYFII